MSVSLLEEFVGSLDKAERARLKPLKFRGKKRQMLFALVKQQSGKHFSKTTTSRKKNSSAFIHSMRADLLAYAYSEICPKGGLQLLNFLAERGLYRHFSRELSAVEGTILLENSAQEIESFYAEVFKLIFAIPLARLTNDQVWAKLREYPQKYIDSKQNKDPHDYLLPEVFIIGLDMRQAVNEHRPPELLTKIEDRLQAIRNTTQETDNILLKVLLNRRMIIFYKNVKIDFQKVQTYHEAESRLLESDERVAEFVPIDMRNLYAAELAYFRADFDTAYNYFIEEYHAKRHPLRSWAIAYAQIFVLVAHAKKEFHQSEIILRERFLYFLDFYHSPHAVLTCILFARQNFYVGNYTRTAEYVALGLQHNTGSLFDPVHDLDLRILENAIKMIEGNFRVAHDLAQANVRVCARRGYKLSTSRVPQYFKFIEESADALVSNTPIPEKTKERLLKFPPPYTYPKVILDRICEIFDLI